jgi:hypothetical protein
MSYAVYWQEGQLGPRYAGRLELGQSTVELSGSAPAGRFVDSISFQDIMSVRFSARILRVCCRDGTVLDVGSVDGPGSMRELVDSLALALRELA